MTDPEEPKAHINPPISAGKNRTGLINRSYEFRNWIIIGVFCLHKTDQQYYQAEARRKSNAEFKAWCVRTTRHPWSIVQVQRVVYDSRPYMNTHMETHTYFCFSNTGEAALFRLTFGGEIIEGTLS